MKTPEDVIASINNVEFDSSGEPLYSYDQMKYAIEKYFRLDLNDDRKSISNNIKTIEQICQEHGLVDKYGAAEIDAIEAMKEYADQQVGLAIDEALIAADDHSHMPDGSQNFLLLRPQILEKLKQK